MPFILAWSLDRPPLSRSLHVLVYSFALLRPRIYVVYTRKTGYVGLIVHSSNTFTNRGYRGIVPFVELLSIHYPVIIDMEDGIVSGENIARYRKVIR